MKAGDNSYLEVFVITVRDKAILKEELDNFEVWNNRNVIKRNIMLDLMILKALSNLNYSTIMIAKFFNYQ